MSEGRAGNGSTGLAALQPLSRTVTDDAWALGEELAAGAAGGGGAPRRPSLQLYDYHYVFKAYCAALNPLAFYASSLTY